VPGRHIAAWRGDAPSPLGGDGWGGGALTRVPQARARERTRAARASAFDAAPGWRPAAAGLAALIALMLTLHQLYVEGPKPLLRLFVLLVATGFAALAWYLLQRGRRRGPALRVGPEGVGIALGFAGWLEVPWERVRAWRYWEPTGFAVLVKRRQARWVGFRLTDEGALAGRPWDQRLEMALNRLQGRPALCVLAPFVAAPILEVLESFQAHAAHLDDREGRIV
jgi:hypothetical protein